MNEEQLAEKKAYLKNYREKNRERIKKVQSAWYDKQGMTKTAYSRLRRFLNPEKYAANTKRYNDKKPRKTDEELEASKLKRMNYLRGRNLNVRKNHNERQQKDILRLHAKGRDMSFIALYCNVPMSFIQKVLEDDKINKISVDGNPTA